MSSHCVRFPLDNKEKQGPYSKERGKKVMVQYSHEPSISGSTYKRIDLFNTRTVVQLPAVFSPPTV